MKTICSYCHKVISKDNTGDPEGVSHGICKSCYEQFQSQWKGQSLGQYLDSFDMPVLVVDSTCRIIAANQEMAGMLGRSERQAQGLLGGEAMECVYSKRVEGCGKDEHCSTCAIRNSITHTAQTGETLHHIECYVQKENGKDPLMVSTVKVGRSVQVVFEPAPAEESGES